MRDERDGPNEEGLVDSQLRASNEGLPPSRYITSGERPRLPSTARIGRAPFHRARSASKEGTWPLPSSFF